jgi:hypothetical protein
MKTPARALKDLICQKQTKPLVNMIEEVLNEYIGEQLESTNPSLTEEIRCYINYVRQANLGTLITGFTFKSPQPLELVEFLQIVSLRENAQYRAAYPLLEQSNHRVLQESGSAKVVFEQACRLEKALQQKVVPPLHASRVQDKLISLIQNLYPQFARLIVNAKSAQDLLSKLNTAFDKTLCADLEEVGFALETIEEQFLILSNTAFFDNFYHYKTLVDKTNYIDEYCHYMEQQKTAPMTNLKDSLECLMLEVQLKAYQSCQKKQHQLMNDPTMTVAELIAEIDHWTQSAWQRYEGSLLIDELESFLNSDQKDLEAWEQLSALQRPSTPLAQPAFEVFTFKYSLGDPHSNPAVLLRNIQHENNIDRPSSPELPLQPLAVIDHEVLYEQINNLSVQPNRRSRSNSF